MTPVFVALTAEGLSTARRAQSAIGGEVHALASVALRQDLLPLWEKVPDGSAGGRMRGEGRHGNPSSDPAQSAGPPSPTRGEGYGARTIDGLLTFTDVASHLRLLFDEGTPIVGVCAAGILIRVLAPLLSGKHVDPPVLAMSEDGASVVPLLGGHSGANDLARRIADALGGHAAITTTGDNRFGVTLDAPPEGWTLANPNDAKSVMAALLSGASVRLEGKARWLEESRIAFTDDGEVNLVATTRAIEMRQGEASALTSPLRGGRNPEERSEPGFREGGAVRQQTPSRSSPSLHSANSDLPSRGRLDGAHASSALTLIYHPRRLAVGIGCERGADPDEAIALVASTLRDAGLAPEAVALVASLDLKADEPAVLAAADHLGVPARFFSAATLEAETPRLQNPSDAVFREVGCHGVAEGAALAITGPDGALVVAKRKSARVTCAIAEAPDVIDAANIGRARGRLAIVGIGPGAADWLTPEARRLLTTSDAAVGYSLYLDLVAPLIADAERFDSKLGAEEARVRQALTLAAEGRAVALISSGDAGIYAMATLAFECLDKALTPEAVGAQETGLPVTSPLRGGRSLQGEAEAGFGRGAGSLNSEPPSRSSRASSLRSHASNSDLPSRGRLVDLTRGPTVPAGARRAEIVVAPGITAMQAAAARAGAPLGHDFCAISLSDLLTPWETIETRIRAAAEGDFVIAFYNPVSQRRRTQLAEAKAILLRHRPPDTPVILARNLGRDGESVTAVPLHALNADNVDMRTLVIVGASSTRQVDAAGRTWTYTPRGYEKKRNADAAE